MSIFAPKQVTTPSKVHDSEYIRTENKPDEGAAAPQPPSVSPKPEAE
jgi:hypothetical protein